MKKLPFCLLDVALSSVRLGSSCYFSWTVRCLFAGPSCILYSTSCAHISKSFTLLGWIPVGKLCYQ